METKTSITGDAMGTNSGDEPISRQVVDAVAAAKGVDPLELPPLYDTVDPDALDSLFGGSDAGAAITDLRFEIAGCEVLVRGSDDVVVVRSDADLDAVDAEADPVEGTPGDVAGDRCGIDVGGNAGFDTYLD